MKRTTKKGDSILQIQHILRIINATFSGWKGSTLIQGMVKNGGNVWL